MAKPPLGSGEIGVKAEVDRLSSAKLKRKLDDIAAIPLLIFSKERLEDLLLSRTKDRFKLSGPNAQKDPSGRKWKPLSPNTRKPAGLPILVRTGNLRDSITIVRSNMRSVAALSSPTGAGFSIGVPANSPAAAYARVHQFGGYGGRGGATRIPQRRYLGVGKDDLRAVDRLMNAIATEQILK